MKKVKGTKMRSYKKSAKLLTWKDEIREYLGNISNYMFRKYMSLGMPARFNGEEWVAHTDNIDAWLKTYSNPYKD